MEAFAVLVRREKPGRSLSRADLIARLETPGVYKELLKLCLEQDTTKDLFVFRKGLLWVVKAVGVSNLSSKTNLSRLSLYRMLSRQGNPRLDSLLALFKALGLNMWLVDDDFLKVRQKIVRPKDLS